jgi:hypothetical protein
MGRVVYQQMFWDNWGQPSQQSVYENRVNFTLQTFNGVQLTPAWTVGGTTGIDWYNTALVLPIAAGGRYEFIRKANKKIGLQAAFDAGYGFTTINPDLDGYKTSGGLMLHPSLGLRIGLKSKSALLISLGQKHQQLTIDKTVSTVANGIENRIENRKYNRMAFTIGVCF